MVTSADLDVLGHDEAFDAPEEDWKNLEVEIKKHVKSETWVWTCG